MRLRKKPTVVEATQVDVSGDYGVLGTMASGDYIIKQADGIVSSLEKAYVEANYDAVDNNVPLQGDDIS